MCSKSTPFCQRKRSERDGANLWKLELPETQLWSSCYLQLILAPGNDMQLIARQNSSASPLSPKSAKTPQSPKPPMVLRGQSGVARSGISFGLGQDRDTDDTGIWGTQQTILWREKDQWRSFWIPIFRSQIALQGWINKNIPTSFDSSTVHQLFGHVYHSYFALLVVGLWRSCSKNAAKYHTTHGITNYNRLHGSTPK